MNTRMKATLAAAGVALAGLMVLAAMFGALSALFPAKPHNSWSQGPPRIEMMPENSPEFLEKHYPGPDGKDLKTEIQYRNGDFGVKIYRADNTLAEWTITFRAGGTKLHAVFAKDGKQVILGEEFRADRTLKWQASNKDSVVTTKTYYYDGNTVFSVVQRGIGADVEDASYFRLNGNIWMRQIAGVSDKSKPQLEEVWNLEGQKVYARRSSDKDGKTATDITYFRPDGTAKFTQHWTSYTYQGYGYEYGDYYYPSSTTVVSWVEEYGEDGTTVTRRLDWTDDGSDLKLITEFAADGTSVVSTVQNGEITHVDKKDKDGSVIASPEPKPGTKAVFDDELKKAIPSAPKPVDWWKTQEQDESQRGQDAPDTP